MAKLEVLIFLFVNSANCAFFDLTDVDDPLSLFWHTNKVPSKNSACIVPIPGTGSVLPGQCKHKTLCLLSGGQIHAHDNCGNFLTCCTQPVICSKRTKAKVSYFTNDGLNFIPECEYLVETYNDNVCQVRLDFEQFRISSSQEVQIDGMTSHRTCSVDYLSVSPNTYNILPFCGNNDGQHVYVHLHSQKELRLKMHLADRGSSTVDVPNPKWRIKVTQIECPVVQNFITKSKILATESEFRLLAPEGATQYFTELSGRIRSFGFTNGYTSNLRYGISFRRTPNVNCLWLTANFVTVDNSGTNVDTTCSDYLFISEYQEVFSGNTSSELCADTDTNQTKIVFTSAPGPFNIFFRTQPSYAADAALHAFDVQYELKTC